MELKALIIQTCNQISEDMRRGVINITFRVEEVARRNGGHTVFTEDKSPCNGLSFCRLVSSIVIKIKILLTDQILDNFIRHSVCYKCYFRDR
jgi:hypothetical protein